MAEKRVFKLVHATARRLAMEAVQTAPEGYCVTVAEPTRSLDQNAAMWPILQAFADQLQWPVNGAMVWMTPDEINASAERHRSPLVSQCVSDYLAGRRFPLELLRHYD